jgi:hypothetical protein
VAYDSVKPNRLADELRKSSVKRRAWRDMYTVGPLVIALPGIINFSALLQVLDYK